MSDTQGLKPGAMLRHDTYRIERMLGQGGFGITYLATHVRLKRKVAIKEFFPKAFCDRDADTSHVRTASNANSITVEKLKNKFIKEAEHIAEMDSQFIVKISDVFEENHTAYYIMDYIEGSSLSDIVKKNGPLPEKQAFVYISKIGEALTYIHSKRMNHLDVKPANIMIRAKDDTPILIDFGLSKQYDSEGNQTSTTPVGISHGYAPIEQYRDGGVKEFSPQTDLYSLAATLYYILSGVTPPQATTLVEDDLTFPASIPASLIDPISRAMSPKRKSRHESIIEFVREISVPKVKEETEFSKDTYTPKPEPEKSTCKQTGVINGHGYVDLGLPSGLKWATCNIGTTSPEGYGDYFAWGETNSKSSYTDGNSLTFGKSIKKLKSERIIDSNGVLTKSHDAASSKWGSSWRMPTQKEFDELVDKCEWQWTTLGGKTGYKVTGPNKKSIFLPAAGYRRGSSLYRTGEDGYCGSSSVYDDAYRAYYLGFLKGIHGTGWGGRNAGYSVRPVSE